MSTYGRHCWHSLRHHHYWRQSIKCPKCFCLKMKLSWNRRRDRRPTMLFRPILIGQPTNRKLMRFCLFWFYDFFFCIYLTHSNQDNLDNKLLVNRGRTRGRKKDDKANNKEQCPDCGLFVRFLNQHMITHSTKKPHECEICQMTFTRASSLKKHVRFVHMDIR